MPSTKKVTQLRKFKDTEFEYEKEKPPAKEHFYVYPLYVESLKKLKLTPESNMADAELNAFMSNVKDPENFDKEVVHMIRIRAIDRPMQLKFQRR